MGRFPYTVLVHDVRIELGYLKVVLTKDKSVKDVVLDIETHLDNTVCFCKENYNRCICVVNGIVIELTKKEEEDTATTNTSSRHLAPLVGSV